MKFVPVALVSATLIGFSGMAMASSSDTLRGADRTQIDELLSHAEQAGMTAFKEMDFEHERGNLEFEVEGWSDDGFELDMTIAAEGGTVLEQSRSRTIEQAWGLSADQLGTLLDRATSDGFERISELDLSRSGNIEIEGYDSNNYSIERNYGFNNLFGNQ